MPLMPGTNLGAYKILSLLGSGGMGEVYCALDPKLARRVAIKVLPDAVSGNADSLARFEREARALAALQHPGILEIHDFGHEGEWSYTVTELLEGRTLREKLGRGPLPLDRCLQIAAELASALAAAHERGIIHRDLKPGNIFILKDGRMKLLDFGLAKQVSMPQLSSAVRDRSTEPIQTGGDTEPGLLLGTAGYMAPEQVHGASMDARTDIFAFGCLFFEMCTGRKLFKRDNLVDTLHAILSEEPDLKDPLIPPAIAQVIQRCLEKDPARRYQCVLDLAYTLESFRSLPQYQPTASPRSRRWGLFAAAAALLMIGGVAAFAGVLWGAKPVAPTFRMMTYQRGDVGAARFTADGSRVVYSARWGSGPLRLFIGAPGSTKAEPLVEGGAGFLALSKEGDLALAEALRQHPAQVERIIGRLVQRPLAGGAARVLAEGVSCADWGPAGNGLAVVRRVEGRDRVEYPLGHVLAESRGWISHLRFAPKGPYLAYLDHPREGGEGGTVRLINLGSEKAVDLGEAWGSLQGLAWAPGGKEVWFTAGRNGGSRALYASSLSGVQRFVYGAPRDLTLQDISSGGSVLLLQVETSGGMLGKPPAEEARPVGLDRLARAEGMSDDGNRLLFSALGEASARQLFLLDASTGERRAFGLGTHSAVSPEGDRILVSRQAQGRWQFLVYPSRGGDPRVLSLGDFTSLHGVGWHPDGRSIFLCGSVGAESPRIWKVGLDQPDPQPMTPEGIDAERPFGVSPDGRWLIAALGPVVYRFDLQNAAAPPQPLPGVDPTDRIMGFEDGEHLLLSADAVLPVQVYSFAMATGKRRAAFRIPALGHEGALLDRAFQSARGGDAYLGSYLEVQSSLFCVEGLK